MEHHRHSRGHGDVAWLPLIVLAALVLWLPLPFGSVVPWSHGVLQITACLLLALAALSMKHASDLRPAVLPAACIAAVALLGALQASTFPVSIVRTISPEHARLQALARETLAKAGFTGEVPSALSLAPSASRHAALTFAAVAACVIAGCAMRVRRERRVIAFALLASAMLQVLYGASALAMRGATIWGRSVAGGAGRLRGSFVNADHLAFYLELALPVAFAWGWWAVRRAREATAPERRIALVAGPVLIWLTLFVGLAFTGSRAGLVAAMTGTVVQGVLLAASRRRWRGGITGVLVGLVGVGAVAAVGLQQGLGRWLATSQHELTWNDRLKVYATSWDLWHRFPWTGAGLSSFRDAFSLLAPRELTGVTYWHAHNDYLEVLVTTGIVGAVLIAVAAGVSAVRLARGLREGERTEDRAAALAALGALAAVAVHSCLDFGLSMPANAATLAVVVGAALAARRGGEAQNAEV
ncbi:MAG TPA: O-antigen ligase family protein [Thermoanaerobaculaceae bacterium]|nr:O-antigen ligase family protein [Thermoanaerobaculaceae bacterium]